MFFDDGDGGVARELGVADDEFLVTFAGTLGIAQALPSVLDAAALLGDDVEFAFVGDGPMKTISSIRHESEGSVTCASIHRSR